MELGTLIGTEFGLFMTAEIDGGLLFLWLPALVQHRVMFTVVRHITYEVHVVNYMCM